MKPEDTRLQVKKFIRSARDKVFQAWIQPDMMRKWFAPGEMTVPHAEADAVVGKGYRIQMRAVDGTVNTTSGIYREIVPGKKLVFTWGWEGPERVETLVTVDFIDKDDGTEVTVTHERFTNPEQAKMHTEGWIGCLESLVRFLSAATH